MFSILLAVLLLSARSLAVAAAVNGTCGDLIVRAVLNEGFVTSHKNCTDADFEVMLDAIAAVFGQPGGGGNDRNLLASSEQQHHKRQLQSTNCADLCEGKTRNTCMTSWNYACFNYAQLSSNCPIGGLCYRKLQETVTFLILDDMFYDQDGPAVPGTRKLETTCGISEEECILAKAELYQAILSILSDIDTECANLVLSPNVLQCIVSVHG